MLPFAHLPSPLQLEIEGFVVQNVIKEQQEQDPTNLYISNLPVSMDEQELENMLKPLGHVISTRILRDANGVSRGVGFARMESTEKCEVVIQHFNGKYLKTPPGIPGPTEQSTMAENPPQPPRSILPLPAASMNTTNTPTPVHRGRGTAV
ncbi:unnamed protein product [Boreogadus saida]